ncbi:MAG TPA: hypothetical protein DDW52_23360, partial [Planctomycetaceae bacterium]|nr:hypothetical protein [Planctomycetaceae bacterium]
AVGQSSDQPAKPAFGPGSKSFGGPFFHTPGQTSVRVQDLPLPKRRDAPSNALPKPAGGGADAQAKEWSTPAYVAPVQRRWETQPRIENAPVMAGDWRFNFQAAPWTVVIKNFARANRKSLVFMRQPTGTFTYFDERTYSFVEALDVLNDYLVLDGWLLVRNEQKLTLISAAEPLPEGVAPFVALDVLPTLGRNELVSLALAIRTPITPQLVDEVRQLMTPIGQIQVLTGSQRLVVTDTGSSLRRLKDLLNGTGVASSDLRRQVIRLRHARSAEVAAAINQRLGNSGSAATSNLAGGVVSASASASGGAQAVVVAEPQTNSLLIEGTPEELDVVQSLIAELDQAPGQVVIQALLVEVVLGNTREQGVELGFQDSVLFDRSIVDNVVTITETITNPNGVQTSDQRILSQSATPGFPFNGAPLGNNTSVRPSTVGRQSVSNLGLGRVSGDLGFGGLVLSAGSNTVNVLLRALAEKHKIEVLSRPQVTAVNNREALIQIGQQVPVVDGVTITPNGNANPVVRQDKAGVILRVTPQIADDGSVQIDVQAEKSAYQLVPGSGVPIFTDATTGNVIEAPVKDITTAETTVTAYSGQTIALGGMITRDESEVERKVPVLGDIPLLGRLFRVDFKQANRKELLIFLTPTVVRDTCHSDSINAGEASRLHVCPSTNIDLHRDFLDATKSTMLVDPGAWPDQGIGPGLIETLPPRPAFAAGRRLKP